MDKTLLFKAAEAAQGINAAQTAIEDRKRAVDEAKAAVETAKADLVEAKADYDAVIAEFVASGVPASKVKRNVEDFLRILGDLGFVEASNDEATAPAEPKAPRRKKAEAAPSPELVSAVAKLSEQGEPGVTMLNAQDGATSSPAEMAMATEINYEDTETASEHPAATDKTAPLGEIMVETLKGMMGGASESQVEVVAHEEVSTSQPEDESAATTSEEQPDDQDEVAVEETPSPNADASAEYEVDNTEAFTEILDLIETIAVGEPEAVSETLVTLLNAADWFSREWEKQPLDVQFYRDILNLEFVESALKQTMGDDLRDALVAVQINEESPRILDWFANALDLVEAGAAAKSYREHVIDYVASYDYVVSDDLDQANEEPAVEEASEVAEEAVSDDARLVGETVEDIGEINFLEDAASVFAGATVVSVEPAKSEPAAENKPAEPRSFRPRFLGSKSQE